MSEALPVTVDIAACTRQKGVIVEKAIGVKLK